MTKLQEHIKTPLEDIKDRANTNIDLSVNTAKKLKKKIRDYFASSLKNCWTNIKYTALSAGKSTVKSIAGFTGTVGALVAAGTLSSTISKAIGTHAPHFINVFTNGFLGKPIIAQGGLVVPMGIGAQCIFYGALGLSALSLVAGTVRGYKEKKFKAKEKELQNTSHKINCMEKCLENNPSYKLAKEKGLQKFYDKKAKIREKILEEKMKTIADQNGTTWLSVIPGIGNTLDILWRKIEKSPLKPIVSATTKTLGYLYDKTIGYVWNCSFSPKDYEEKKLEQNETELYLTEMLKIQNEFLTTLTKEDQQKIFENYQKELSKLKETPQENKPKENEKSVEDIEFIRDGIENKVIQVDLSKLTPHSNEKQNTSTQNNSIDINAIEKIAKNHANQKIIYFINDRFPKDQNGMRQNINQIKQKDIDDLRQLALKEKMKDILKLLTKIPTNKKKQPLLSPEAKNTR